MKIFMTGGSGFVGSHLRAALQNAGHTVVTATSRECDLTRQGQLESIDHGVYDQIYHLAAWTQAGDFCLNHGGEQWIINQQINVNVLAWWQQRQPQAKLITLGTSVSYSTEEDLSEAKYMSGTPSTRYYGYAMTKRMLYAGLISLSRQFGLKYLYLIPSTLYGPDYHVDGRPMHFIYDLIRKILRGKLYGEPVVLWGDGYQRRELVWIGDFVQLAQRLADVCENELINIGGGEEYTIRQFAQIICEQVGYDFKNIQFDKSQFVGAKSKFLAIAKVRRLVPEFAITPIAEGLKQTIEWFLDRREVLLPPPPRIAAGS